MRFAQPLVVTVSILTFAVFAAESPASNSQLLAQAENTWAKVGPACPSPKGILAYSGGAFDRVNGRFLIFGGGHADYWGNEVCAFDPATLSWKKMYEPDAESRYTNENIDNTQGKLKDSDKPYTRHSYNQLCFASKSGELFIYGGCGPGWGAIKPTCPVPPDVWTYSLKENAWKLRFAGKGTPGGYAKACCYDSKRDTVWAFGGGGQLHRFDLQSNTWSTHPVKGSLAPLGGYNFQMEYIPSLDRLMIVGAKHTCTIDLTEMAAEFHALNDANGKAGLTYLDESNALLYFSAPGGETGGQYRLAAFDCASKTWIELAPAQATTTRGGVWDRLHYDPVNKVALLVMGDGVWAYKPPKDLKTAAKKEEAAP